MRPILLAAIASLLSSAVQAHDMWLQPRLFWTPSNPLALITAYVGHGQNRERGQVADDRLKLLKSFGPGGAVDHLATLRPGALRGDLPIRLNGDGTHVLVLESGHAVSELPAIRFNDYLKEEGLVPAQRLRASARQTNMPGREIYSRRAKTLIQVGRLSGAQPQVTRPVGQTLEIVPEQNPYALPPGRPLTVRVYYQGRPLPSATVKLNNLEADAKPVATRVTNAAGRAAFTLPRKGIRQLKVIWTRPINGDRRGDFDTTFASLSFGQP